jgi:3-hydroxyisobutyrate dehydrogenase
VTNDNTNIGFIGLGNMGKPMANHLAHAGYNLMVFDISTELSAIVANETGTKVAISLDQLGAFADIIITCLPNGKVVHDLMLGDGQLAESLSSGNLLIDMSSCDPIQAGQLGEQLKQHKIAMIDAPVSGGIKGAQAGTLTIIIGGNKQDVARAMPLLKILGNNVFHTGRLGSGQAMKALNNLCSATGLLIVAEILKAGKTFGLDPEMMIDILNVSTGRNNSTENKVKQFILSDEYEKAGFAMDLMVKDITTAISFAKELDITMPLGSTAAEIWSNALATLGGKPDHTEIARWVNIKGAQNTTN